MLLLWLIAVSGETTEIETIPKENYDKLPIVWKEQRVEKGDIIDVRVRVGGSFALVISESKFYLDIGIQCDSNNEYECNYWYNTRLNGLYALGPDCDKDYHRVVFTAAETGRIRLIVSRISNVCDRGIVSVISGRSVDNFQLQTGSGSCYISGDLNLPLSCHSENLEANELVQIIYPNISGNYWKGPSNVDVDADFIQVMNKGPLAATFKTPTITSEGDTTFDFKDHPHDEIYMGDCWSGDKLTGWTAGGKEVEFSPGIHTEDDDPSDAPSDTDLQTDAMSDTDTEISDSETETINESDADEDDVVSPDPTPEDDGPSPGAIAGATIGCLAGSGGVVTVVFICIRKSSDKKQKSNTPESERETEVNESEEIPGF